MKKRAVFAVLAFVILFVGLLLIGFARRGGEKAQTAEKRPGSRTVPVTVVRPTQGPIARYLTLTAEIRGINDTYVFPDVPGRFLRYLVEEGQRVKKDQPVAEIERSLPGLAYKPALVHAPASGIVSLLGLEQGNPVGPTTPIARVAQIHKVKAVFRVPERYAGVVRKGLPVTIQGPDGVQIQATVVWRSSFLSPQTRTVEVHAEAENPDGALLPGMFAKVIFPVEKREEALLIPTRCLLGEVQKYVFVVRDGRAHRVPVTVGIQTPEVSEILEGLKGDEAVIDLGAQVVREGDSVEVKGS